MPMVFPSSPTVGQVFSSGGRSWVWTGSTWDSPAGSPFVAPGLTQVANFNFTSSATINIDNVFTDRFDHYRLIYTWTKSTASGFTCTVRTAGAAGGTGTYRQQTVRSYGNTVDASPNSSGSNAWQSTHASGNSQSAFYVMDLMNPAVATLPTFMTSSSFGYDGGIFVGGTSLGGEYSNAIRDGIGIAFTSGTATGNVKVYGYRNTL